MTDGFDVARSVACGILDRGRAWGFIRSFAASWDGPLAEGDGIPVAELASAGAELGLSLPAALGEFYGLVGRRSDLVGNQDSLLPHPYVFTQEIDVTAITLS